MNPSSAMKPVLAPLALAIQLACAGLAAAPALAQTAHAASAISYAIPAGPLGATLHRFVAASGVFVVADDRLTLGKNSAGLRGVHGPNEALTQLLAGTGLQAVMQASGGFALRPVDTLTPAIGATTLSAVTVTANLENATGATVGYVAKRSAAGTKTDTPLLEIAQSINVVTADEIRARGAISVSQALRYTPGVTASGYTENYMLADEMSSRSFSPAPLYLDGAYMPYAGSLGGAPQIEPYSLERVEVFKGPASVLYGQNQPGGIINMVTKKPQAEAVREVLVGVGSYGRVNAALDIGGAVDENSELLYRLLVLANDGKQQTDHTRSSRTFVAPSLTWKPSADTTLTLSAQLQHDKGVPDYQAQAGGTGRRLLAPFQRCAETAEQAAVRRCQGRLERLLPAAVCRERRCDGLSPCHAQQARLDPAQQRAEPGQQPGIQDTHGRSQPHAACRPGLSAFLAQVRWLQQLQRPGRRPVHA